MVILMKTKYRSLLWMRQEKALFMISLFRLQFSNPVIGEEAEKTTAVLARDLHFFFFSKIAMIAG